MALLDPSSYYLSLANAALFMDQYFTHRTSLAYTNTIESTKYFSKCLTLVTRQLAYQARSKVISEGVITTVLGFACHSFTIKNWDLGEMHMQGLERIIRLRGGLQGLGDLVPLFVSWYVQYNLFLVYQILTPQVRHHKLGYPRHTAAIPLPGERGGCPNKPRGTTFCLGSPPIETGSLRRRFLSSRRSIEEYSSARELCQQARRPTTTVLDIRREIHAAAWTSSTLHIVYPPPQSIRASQ